MAGVVDGMMCGGDGGFGGGVESFGGDGGGGVCCRGGGVAWRGGGVVFRGGGVFLRGGVGCLVGVGAVSCHADAATTSVDFGFLAFFSISGVPRAEVGAADFLFRDFLLYRASLCSLHIADTTCRTFSFTAVMFSFCALLDASEVAILDLKNWRDSR